jgi:hypothetical protein
LEELALLFPPAIFPETHEKIISIISENRVEKTLHSIKENIMVDKSVLFSGL